jgi:hypothetical protein
MKALIAPNGQVAQIEADDKTFPVHLDLSWVDCDGTVTTNHTYDGAVFVAPVVPDPPTAMQVWGTVRTKRTQLLHDTDWTVLADAPLTAAQKTAWEAYRQALRDLPAQDVGPGDVVWPIAP